MFSFVKTVKRPICKTFIEFIFRHIPLFFSVYLLNTPSIKFSIAFPKIPQIGIMR